jgi:hypothetical protein
MAESTKPRVAKKPISEKQLIANRLNSKRSTGPRTPEGKARASMNNCRTGMRSSKDVLPGEDRTLYEQRRRNAIRDLGPRNDTETALVERHVRLEWRGLRGEAAEDAKAARRIHEVIEGADQREAAEAERLARDLEKCPENLRQLLRIPAGVRLMLGEWAILRDRLARYKTLLGTQRRRALALVGRCREDALRDDPIALRWMRAQLGAMYDNATPEEVAAHFDEWLPEGMSRSEFRFRMEMLAGSLPASGEARALLVSYVAEEIRRLEDHLAVLEPLAQRNLALDAQEARWDRTAEGARLGQQVLASYRGSDAALRRLEALQNPRRPGPGRGPTKTETPAPAPAPEQPCAATVDPSNPEPAQASAPKTAEAILEQAGKDVAVAQGEGLGSQPAGKDECGRMKDESIDSAFGLPPSAFPIGQAPSGWTAAGFDAEHPGRGSQSESHSQPGPSVAHAAEVLSQPRADEAILPPQTAEVLATEPECGDDPGPQEPQDPTFEEVHQQIEAIRRRADDQAAAELSREQERWEQARKERLDQEWRQQLEELDRRNQAFFESRRDPPDRGGRDPAAGGEAGRAPPSAGTA